LKRNDNIFDGGGRNDLHWTAMIYNDGKFYMFYNSGMAPSGPTPQFTSLALSEDGEKFVVGKQVVLHPSFGSWDDQMIEAHSVIRVGGRWRMYYCGYDGNWRVGFAESEDLIEWKKHPEPILDIGDAYWESTHVADPHVIFFRGKYLMYYMGKGSVWQVGLAESNDGIEWDKRKDNPLIKADREWCNGCVALSGLLNYNGKLLATMHGYNTIDEKFRTKLFESENGMNWKPVCLNTGQEFVIEPGKWNNRGIVHPEPILTGKNMIIYFTGIRKAEPNQHRIGRVVLNVEDILL